LFDLAAIVERDAMEIAGYEVDAGRMAGGESMLELRYGGFD